MVKHGPTPDQELMGIKFGLAWNCHCQQHSRDHGVHAGLQDGASKERSDRVGWSPIGPASASAHTAARSLLLLLSKTDLTSR